jgi:hypothetical protein
MEQERFSDFIKEVLNSFDFDWFVTLGHNPATARKVDESRSYWEGIWAETDPDGRHWKKTSWTVEESFDEWLDWACGPPDSRGRRSLDYVWLGERRGRGEVRFHVLIARCGDGEYRGLLHHWQHLSGGWAFTRQLDERIGGLIGYLVMREGCLLELNCGAFREQRSASDFIPWNSTRY